MMQRIRPAASPFFLAFLVAALAGGCKGKGTLPKTFPVAGMVSNQQGRPFSGGTIRFQSPMDSGLTVAGEIQPDGTFTLYTNNDRNKTSGAAEGWYRVTVISLAPPAHRLVDATTLPMPYHVEAKENYFRIRINPSRR